MIEREREELEEEGVRNHMDVKKIVVVVEDVEAARIALQWTLRNIIRYGDIITLLHVYHHSTTTKARLLRLNGFKLALSFQDMICNNYPNTKVEIIVAEGEGAKIAATVREIGASMLVVGLHHSSFLYKFARGHSSHNSIGSIFSCRVLAIKQPHHASPLMISAVSVLDSSTNLDFSQIELSRLQVPSTPPPKIPYRICPNPSAIIWRSRKSRRR